MKPIKLSPEVSRFLTKLKVVGKHHYFIFTILLLCGLTAAVYVVDTTLAADADQTYYDQKQAEALNANFDAATIEKIENLQKSDEHSAIAPTLPAGARTNPFAE